MRKILTLVMFISLTLLVQAQQEAHFTHYMFNTLAVNPAYAGSRGALTVTGLYRNQWIGFKGAPVTQTITGHAPLLKDKLGLGLSAVNDRIGPTSNTSVYADFAYRIPLGQLKKGKLSLGIKGGINILRVGLNEIGVLQGMDPSFSENYTSKVMPNFGFGVYYHTTNFYLGASVPKLLENYYTSRVENAKDEMRERRHYNLIAGGMIKLGKKVKLKPSFMLKIAESTPPVLDFTTLLYLLNDRFWIGPAFRTAFKSNDAVSAIVGVNVIKQLAIGYAFDYSLVNKTFEYNHGSHELMLRYDFIYGNNKKVKSPRYF